MRGKFRKCVKKNCFQQLWILVFIVYCYCMNVLWECEQLPFSAAQWSTLSPCLDVALTFAPCSIKCSTISGYPRLHKEQSQKILCYMKREYKSSSKPFVAAIWRGVAPISVSPLTWAPCSMRILTISTFPELQMEQIQKVTL